MFRSRPAWLRLSVVLAHFGALLLVLANPARADEQPLEPTIRWPGINSSNHDSPNDVFSHWQNYLTANNSAWNLRDLRVCAPQDLHSTPHVVRINQQEMMYCATWYYLNGSGEGPQVVTTGQPLCSLEKPDLNWLWNVPQTNEVSDRTMWCDGGAPGGQRPQPPPPALEPSCCANPIVAETRTKIERAVDLALPGALRFDRVYTSNGGDWRHSFSDRAWDLNRNTLPSSSVPSPACLQATFVINGVKRAKCQPYLSNQSLLRSNAGDWFFDRADGRTLKFSAATGRSMSLGTRETGHQILDGVGQYDGLVVQTENGSVEEFDKDGRLVKRLRLDGSGVVLTYLGPSGQKTPASAPSCAGLTAGPMAPGKPSCVTDRISGRQLLFAYDPSGNLTSVTDPSGAVVAYQYDGPTANGAAGTARLTSVIYPDLTQRTYHYNESARTAGADIPGALTGITDEASVRYAFFGYDANGLATASSHANGVYSFTINSNSVVTDPLGTQTTYWKTQKTALASDNSVATSVIAPTGRTRPSVTGSTVSTSVTYDSQTNVASRTDFNGTLTTYGYDLTRRLETQRVEASGTPQARTIRTQWHPDWQLRTQVAEPKRMTWWIYNGQPDPTNGNATLTCAPGGALIDWKPIAVLCKQVEQGTTDVDGTAGFSATLTGTPRAWTYTYNADGRVLTANGPRADVTDTTTYTYYAADDAATPQRYRRGDLETVTNALGHTTTFNTYNGRGQPLTITDPNGVVTTLTYDARARLTSRSIGSETTTFSYWPTGLLKRVTLPDTSYVEHTYDDAHRLVEIEDGDGNRIEYTLDNMGNRTAENVYDPSNALARTRTQVFNNLNRLWKEVTSGGIVAANLGYDNDGNLLSNAAALGRNTSNQYDEHDRLKQITDPLTGVTQFAYDAADNLTSVTDPRNLVTSYVYNGFGEVTQTTSPDTGTSTSTYDSAGNLATRTDSRSKTGTYTYDALNRVTSIAYPDLTSTFTYDAGTNGKGRLTGASDALHSMAWTYDAQGRVATRSQTVGTQTHAVTYGYTGGNLTSQVTPSGQTLTYGYSNGRVASVAVNSTTILNNVLHDPFGSVRQWQWGNGTLAVRTFDLDGKLTQLDSAGLRDYAYDDAFRITAIDDLDDVSLSRTFTYDSGDRLTLEMGTAPSVTLGASSAAPGDTVAVTVNDVPANSGYWLTLATPGAPNTTYIAWTAVGAGAGPFVWNVTAPAYAGTYEVRLFAGGSFMKLASSSSLAVSAPPTPPQATLNVSATGTAPGTSVTVRLASAPGGSTDWLALAAVGAPNTTYLQWTYVGSGVTSRDWTVTLPSTAGNYEVRLFLNNGYTLAAASPAVAATNAPQVATPGSGGSQRSYTYDINGNRLTQGGAGASTFTVASTSNRLLSVSGGLTRTNTHDAAGNITNDGAQTFGYNDAGRMTSASGALSATYTQNVLGQRVRKIAGGVTTYFVYDEAGRLIGEYSGSGALVQEIVWLEDTPVAVLRPNGSGGIAIYYVHSDHLSTPRRISRPGDNTVVWRWDSDAFGTSSASEDPDGDTTAFTFNLRFPGQYFDVESGRHYNYFRDYDPVTGGYLQSDPIGLNGGINTYGYVGSNPVSGIDPRGLFGLNTVVSWSLEAELPRSGVGGLTVPRLPIRCECQGCGNSWTLGECSGVLHLMVLLLAVSDPEEAAFYRNAEGQHVADFKASADEIRRAGEAAERSQRMRTYATKEECEASAAESIRQAVTPALQRTFNESSARWDKSGRHTWRSLRRYFGF
jgi:RHS repeat-associated protein